MSVQLLLDENLSERLLKPISAIFPGSVHVRSLGKSGAGDAAVWEVARVGGYTLITRDEDFVGMSVLRGAPPKVIWLNTGNARNAAIETIVRGRVADIEQFCAHPDHTFLVLGAAELPPA